MIESFRVTPINHRAKRKLVGQISSHLVLQLSGRAFNTRTFHRWADKAGVTDTALLDAMVRMERGLIDADLGGYLYKQRVALPGRGKSGSTRTIIARWFAGVLFFLYGFEKSHRDNISAKELVLYQRLARGFLDMTEAQIATALAAQVLMEVRR